MEIKQMVEKALAKSRQARNSDEVLLEIVVLMYYKNNFNDFKRRVKLCQFVSSMMRRRRKLQMLGLYEADTPIKTRRHAFSKYWADEQRATKKEISKISMKKSNKK